MPLSRQWWSLATIATVAPLMLVQGCASTMPAPSSIPTYAVVDRATVGGEGGWDFIAYDSSRNRLFISRGDRVQVWSSQSRRLVGEIPGTAGVHGVAFAQQLNRGFTSNGRANSISVFRLDTLNVTDTINVPGDNPDAILYEPVFQRLYSFNGRSHDATVVDAVTLKVLTSVPLGGKPEVAVSDGTGHIFVNIEDSSEIAQIDQASNKVVARWPLSPCVEPTGLAIDVVRRRLFSVCANKIMVVVDSSSGRLVAEVAIGAEPDGTAFDPDLGLVFSANGDGTLTVIHEDDPEHFWVAANVLTQAKARTLSLDSTSHRVYLVTATFGASPPATAQQPKPRPPMLQDSFTVLVVAPR